MVIALAFQCDFTRIEVLVDSQPNIGAARPIGAENGMTRTRNKVERQDPNVVDGFSERFNHLLDRANFPRQNRVAYGARRFDVAHNTFKNWCEKDKIPGRHALLLQIVEELLSDVAGQHNSRAVVGWLVAGDAVPNPIERDDDAIWLVELYFAISDLSKKEGLNFEELPRAVRNMILNRVRSELEKDGQTSEAGQLDLNDKISAMVLVMVDTARSMA